MVTGGVASGDLAYAGVSAGAALAGPDLTTFADEEDPGHVKTFTGLGLVPFIVLSHRNRGQAERHDALGAGGPNVLFSLDDDQAVWVSGSTVRVVTTPPTH